MTCAEILAYIKKNGVDGKSILKIRLSRKSGTYLLWFAKDDEMTSIPIEINLDFGLTE